MDPNSALRWIGLLGGGATLVRGIGAYRGGDKLWLLVGVLVVAAEAVVYVVAPGFDGWASAGLWFALVLGPAVASRLVASAVGRQEHARALAYARIYFALHPSDAAKLVVVDRLAALRLVKGDRAGAEAAYLEVKKRGGATETWAELTRMRTIGAWDELVAYYVARATAGDRRELAGFMPTYLRALGEIGARRELLAELARNERALAGAAASELRTISWLFAFAFTGRRDLVERLMAGPFRQYSEPLKTFWLLTADLAAGSESAVAEMILLRERSDAQVLRAIDHRLASLGDLTKEPLEPSDLALISRMEIALGQEERFGRAARRGPPVVVFALIALNFAAYAFELTKGDTTKNDPLVAAGALYAPLVFDHGEWWRLLTCTFLHAGALHIGMNMLGLYALGPFVERALGRWRFAVVYLAAGLTGSVGILTMDWLRMTGSLPFREPEVAVGASGAIMGVVGATIAITLRGWLRERAPIARRQLVTLAILVLAQSSMDLSTPEISFTAHASGLVGGFLVALLMKHHASR